MKFIYVFSTDIRDVLIKEQYILLKNDTKNNIFVFENKFDKQFSLENTSYTLSNTLTF